MRFKKIEKIKAANFYYNLENDKFFNLNLIFAEILLLSNDSCIGIISSCHSWAISNC